MSTTDLQVLT